MAQSLNSYPGIWKALEKLLYKSSKNKALSGAFAEDWIFLY